MKTELEERTKRFALAVLSVVRQFPRTTDGIEVGRQMLRSAMSVGANYREANRAESKDDFIHKVGLAEKEASETGYWLEICEAAPLGKADTVRALLKEANELLAILITIGRKARKGAARSITVTLLMPFFLSLPSLSVSHPPA
jgi:four helix bundle protein